MNRITQSYKRSPAKTLSDGIKSILGGSKKSYFILEHRVGSRYHHAGEQQKITADRIEIGRDDTCQVRFDEAFETVSRRHAAIIKDGNCLRLVPLSTTNPTLLNGKEVRQEWFLQHGDEIQCAVNGPKLGFVIPSKAGSTGLNRRLHLFGKQVLAPYKRVLIAVMCVLLFLIIAGIYFVVMKEKKINDYVDTVQNLSDVIDNYTDKITDYQTQIDSMSYMLLQDKELQEQLDMQISRLNIDFEKIRLERATVIDNAISSDDMGFDMSVYHPYIYLLKIYKITVDGEVKIEVDPNEHSLWSGTGFMLNDGRFVTARHVVTSFYSDGYQFDMDGQLVVTDETNRAYHGMRLYLNYLINCGRKVVLHIHAVSQQDTLSLTSDDFVSYGSKDQVHLLEQSVAWNDEIIPAGAPIRVGAGELDWAYYNTGEKEGLTASNDLSVNLRQGRQLFVLEYLNSHEESKPVLSTALCSQNGTDDNGTIMVSNDSSNSCNSGGPVFVRQNNVFEVVGIVSGSKALKSCIIPVAAIDMNHYIITN